MRTIGVVTVGRSDYGIYRPILQKIEADADLQLSLFVTGMHLSPDFGLTVREVEADGFMIASKVEMLLAADTPAAIAKSIGLGVIGFAQAYSAWRPEILLVLGDRFEMLATALAALPFKLPIAHIHGGETTQGAIDEATRHAITKMSHHHFVSTDEYGRRVAQLGEEPWRITVCGAPSLDNLKTLQLWDAKEIERRFDIKVEPPPLLVTFHPVTLEYEQTDDHIEELLAALAEVKRPIVITLPNADTNGRLIIERILKFVAAHHNASVVDNFGTQGYFSMMKIAAAMVGNSSSGIVEAASFKLPVVNIGNRQAGRIRAANVIDVPPERGAIAAAIAKATSPEFRSRLNGLKNPYDKGGASQLIVEKLKTIEVNDRLIAKKFHDLS